MNRKIEINNGNGLKAELTNYGARLMSLYIADRHGKRSDVVLGFNRPEEYLTSEEGYFGATVGRYANRIAHGKFSLGAKHYQLTTNNPPNHLHGGKNGWHRKSWNIEEEEKDKVVMSLQSPDGDEGFPGSINARVTYFLEDDYLKINFKASCDQSSVINMCHHSFFNLGGHDSGSVTEHMLQINSTHFTPVDASLIPTGEFCKVEGTPFDFRIAKSIGKDMDIQNEQLLYGAGFDHNYILKTANSSKMVHAATIKESKSGRVMEVHTNQPGMQFYVANWLSGKDIGKSGKAYRKNEAFCLETQHFPDSPNQEHFPSCIIKPGGIYDYSCWFRFYAE